MYSVKFHDTTQSNQVILSVVKDVGYAFILPFMPVMVNQIVLTQVVSGISTDIAKVPIGTAIPDLRHLALTMEGTTAKLYFRGKLIASATLSTTMTINRVELLGGPRDTLHSEMILAPHVATAETIAMWGNLRAPFFDPSPHIDAGAQPITAGGGRVSIDSQGAFGYDIYGVKRAGFGTDGRWIAGAGAVTADELGLMIKDLVTQELRLHLGNIGGQPWGDGVLAPDTYGLWGDQAGLYLRGYSSRLLTTSCEDGDIIEIPADRILNSPELMITAQDSLIYHPNMTERVNLVTGSQRISDHKWRINAKLVLRGKGDQTPWTPRALSNTITWSERGVVPSGEEADYIICRPLWRNISSRGWVWFSLWITNQFSTEGVPTNWQKVQETTVRGEGLGTLNWDMPVEKGRWAVELDAEQWGPFGYPSQAGIEEWGYSLGNRYMNNDGHIITESNPSTAPSGVQVMVQIFDQG